MAAAARRAAIDRFAAEPVVPMYERAYEALLRL